MKLQCSLCSEIIFVHGSDKIYVKNLLRKHLKDNHPEQLEKPEFSNGFIRDYFETL